ncbi:Ohr family peroxiredoxin [Lactococcus lactis]|uniref:Ohr family peroxiredoxin n=1 Tax=Lactococcus lactis TaxID=1358 RepID=UPI0022B8F4F4|nr:Ohr family peroxiredoxin [Lactococcus lactis]MCZ8491369.1 Ohr family peroxiredoxin [Lactococcus lactis]
MKKIFSTKMINTGGRNGEVHSPDKSFNLDIVAPGRKVEGATNPEQLFAAGYSACFNSALDYIKKSKNIEGESTIEVTVSLYNLSQNEIPDVVLGVDIIGHIEGVGTKETEELLKLTHKTCPYSRATQGNIEVTIKAI